MNSLVSVVIVEDDAAIRAILEMALAAEGFTKVESASRGDEGLEAIRRRKPDLVLLDVMLPGLDGFAICRRMREIPSLAATRVIMLTARTQEHEKVSDLMMGADDYVTKPFSPSELMARIDVLFRRIERERADLGKQYVEEVTSGDFVLQIAIDGCAF